MHPLTASGRTVFARRRGPLRRLACRGTRAVAVPDLLR